MSPFPKTESELKACGYRFKDKGLCRGCQAPILWYETPTQKRIPLDPNTLVPHFSTCPKAKDFKR